MRHVGRFAPALPPVPHAEIPGVVARVFAAWRAGWTAHAATMLCAEQVRARLPWPDAGDARLAGNPQCCG